MATHNVSPELETFVERNPIAPGRSSAAARAALERRTIHIHDVQTDPEYTYGADQLEPVRTVLAIPMLRADELLGVIVIYRHEVRPFTDSQIALMETFADQAAIAIENARLLTELQARTARAHPVGQELQALGEVSQALSSTAQSRDRAQHDRLPRQSARRHRIVHHLRVRRAGRGVPLPRHPQSRRARSSPWRRSVPIRRGEGVAGRMAVTHEPVQIADIAEPGAYDGPLRDVLLRTGTGRSWAFRCCARAI